MTEAPETCPYPGDLEGCTRALVEAWREGRLGEHCIMEGLRKGCTQCREVLLRGLYDGKSTG